MKRNHDNAWWVGEYWCQPIKPESALRSRIRYWRRQIYRFFRPALVKALMWATWPNTEAVICNGYGEETAVEAWIL